jgi:hypothetical protein
MELKNAYEKLITSEEYKGFRKHEKKAYLTHAALITEANTKNSWEFGFYNKETDKITAFSTNPVKRHPEDEAFKKEGATIKKLDIEKISTTYKEINALIEQYRKKNYPSEQIMKIIAILQNLHKQLWNITLITKSFSIINIKIDAKTKEILSASKSSIMDLGVDKV